MNEKYINLLNIYKNRIINEISNENNFSISIKINEEEFCFVKNISKDFSENNIETVKISSQNIDKEKEYHRISYMSNKKTKAGIYSYPENVCILAQNGATMPAILDDMAQIIGTNAKTVFDCNKKILKVLKKRNACIIKGNGVITHGRTLDEAFVACMVLEKTAKSFIDCHILGNFQVINFFETKLMHFVYEKKYSRQNQINMSAGQEKTNIVEDKTIAIEDKEMELRKEIVEAGKKLLEKNLVQGTWGNISIRLDENTMLITPSGLDYLSLKPEDISKVDINTFFYQGKKPSSEKGIHAAIYLDRKDINAVIHSHPINSSSFAAARMELPAINEFMQRFIKGSAKTSEYGLPGTRTLSKSTVKAMEGRNACFMANHGMLAIGKDIVETFETCKILEDSAKQFIENKANEINKEDIPFSEKRKEIFKKRYK